MLTSLPFLSRCYFLGTMGDRRTVLFSCWLYLANDKIFSAINCGVLFFRSLVPQWIMIRSDLLLSVGLIYNYISSVFAPGKDLTTNKSSLVDNSQPLTFLTMESQTTTVTLRPFSFLFFVLLLCFCWSFFMSIFLRFTCPEDLLVVTLFDNSSISLLHPFVSFSSESLRTSYLFWIIFISLSWVLSLFLNEYLLGVSNRVFWTLFYNCLPTFIKRKIIVIRKSIF